MMTGGIEMKHVVICRTDGTVEDMTMTENHRADWYAEQIGARIVQTVYPKGLKDPYLQKRTFSHRYVMRKDC